MVWIYKYKFIDLNFYNKVKLIFLGVLIIEEWKIIFLILIYFILLMFI